MSRQIFRGLLAAECAALVFLFTGSVQAAEQKVLSGHMAAAVTTLNLQPVAALTNSTRLNLAIGLPLKNSSGLSTLLKEVYDPTSPNYRHYLTPEQFAENFGPSAQDYQSVIDFARTNGLTVTGIYSNRTVLGIAGSVSNINRAFHITLREYQHPTENRKFFSPDVEPTVDAGTPILHVQGLNNYVLPHSMAYKMPVSGIKPAAGSGPDGGYIGKDFRNAYLPGVSLNGSGQIVGLFQFDGYNSSDISTYEGLAGLPSVPLQNILLDGFDGSPGANNDEVCLDIESSISMAPGLNSVVVFEGFLADSILASMVSHPEIKQFSASWGYDIDATTEQLYQQLALQGQTFLNASGDGDAWVGPILFASCEDTNITIVGGTTLTMSGTGSAYVSEKAWNWGNVGGFNWNPDGFVGTSGGISTDVGIPSWQKGIDMTLCNGSTTMRNVPDVALTGDNVFVVSSGGEEGIFGGTSCASPLFAGFMAVVNEQAATAGNPSVGFLAPAVYTIAKSATYNDCFHDTVAGDNTWDQSPTNFLAVTGYDLCTGLGTPRGSALIDALAGKAPRTGFLQVTVDPSSGSAILNSTTQAVFIVVKDGGFDVTNATVTAVVAGVTNLTFRNDGQAPDVTSNDAIYSAVFQVPASGSSLTVTLAANAPNEIGTTNTIFYSTLPIPPNDNFSSATKVSAAGGTFIANNQFATLETNEPQHNADANVAASLWWNWTPQTATNVLIDTIGSKIDNVLAVYTGSTLLTLHSVAATNGLVTQFAPAHVSFNAQAGVTYRIAVASASSNSLGSLVLHITPGGQLDTAAPIISNLSPLSGQTVTNRGIVISGTATDPSPNASGVSQVTVTVNGIVTLATGTTNWTAAVALQPALNIVQVSAADAAGNFSAPVTADINFLVPTVANDFFANGIALSGLSGVVSNSNVNATKELGEPDHAGNPGGESLWWNFQAPSDGVLTLSTTNSTFDTLLAVYLGTDVAHLTAIAADDDAYPSAPGGFSRIVQAVKSGQLYHIAVDGFDGASGEVLLAYSFTPATVYQLSVSNTVGGTVQLTTTNTFGDVSVQPSASSYFATGSLVTITPVPDANSQFDVWTGDVFSAVNPLNVTLVKDLNVTANFAANLPTDGFESGDLSQLNWTTAGDAPWYVQTNVVDSGNFAARSGLIGDSQTSSLLLTGNFLAGTGSFNYDVSSEADWDFLNFYVDGVLLQKWSGQTGWANFSFALSAGTHTLEWRYVKDPELAVGLDAAFIDNVNLPLILNTNSTSPAKLQLQSQTGGGYVISLAGQSEQQYVIQVSPDLVHWQNVSTNVANGGFIHIPLTTTSTNQAQFYRAVVP